MTRCIFNDLINVGSSYNLVVTNTAQWRCCVKERIVALFALSGAQPKSCPVRNKMMLFVSVCVVARCNSSDKSPSVLSASMYTSKFELKIK